ncbi:hypothetical protein [Pedobacter sp. UC225_65]|uniref:hypothetical protein n=1 Tax=Pedobacter sp. UC225_65 TaxID=3350173 RepID=UPI00366FD846
MKILITGGTSATALKLLKAFTGHQVVLADYGEVPAFSSAAYRMISLGAKNEDTLAHTLLNYCLDENVEAILPLHHFELVPVAKSAVLFKEFDIEVLLPNHAALAQYSNLGKTENWAVFNQGETIFMTQPNEMLVHKAQTNQLSGAYYFDATDQEPNLSLITI